MPFTLGGFHWEIDDDNQLYILACFPPVFTVTGLYSRREIYKGRKRATLVPGESYTVKVDGRLCLLYAFCQFTVFRHGQYENGGRSICIDLSGSRFMHVGCDDGKTVLRVYDEHRSLVAPADVRVYVGSIPVVPDTTICVWLENHAKEIKIDDYENVRRLHVKWYWEVL